MPENQQAEPRQRRTAAFQQAFVRNVKGCFLLKDFAGA
jgi:hypothetical protein